MRRFKFRAWDKEAKEMLLWKNDRDSIMQAIPIDCGDEWTERCEVMQFTGLYDKRGKEIYEGDIVNYKDCQGKKRTDVVTYEEEWAGFKPFVPSCANCNYVPEQKGIKVIGNIYENPKLLKQRIVK